MSQEPQDQSANEFEWEENDFIRSVSSLNADDIDDAPQKKRRLSDRILDHLRVVLLVVCSLVLAISVVYIGNSLRHYAMADSLYDDLKDLMNEGPTVDMMIPSPSPPTTPDYGASQNLSGDDIGSITGGQATNKEFEKMRIKLANLKAQYPDLYGWIVLPGTNINYPIMQSTDNEYYLTHSYANTYLSAGSIFADFRCEKNVTDNYNLILYGHHMANRTMFAAIDKYLVESFFRNNNKIYIYTLDGMYTYEVFSVYATNKYYPYIRTYFSTPSQFVSFANEIKGNSVYSYEGLTFDGDDRILTLSTCTNRTGDGRLAVHAVLVDTHIGQ